MENQYQVITKQANVQRCNATVDFNEDQKPFFPVTSNDKDLYRHFHAVAGDMLSTKNILDMQPVMGTEDFAFYSEVMPGLFYFVGMVNETLGKFESGHSPYYIVNEDVLPYGAALHASIATRYLLEYSHKSNITTGYSHDEL